MVEDSENVTTSPAAEITPVPVIEKEADSKKPGIIARHPPIAEMVTIAILELKERGGSSTSAIKKYLAATFKVDVKKSAPYIRRYVNYALEKGHLIQIKGGGAAGSFKLSENAKKQAQIFADNYQGKTFLEKKHIPAKPREKKATSDARSSNHPTYAEMVDAAIVALDGKRGSSVVAIKKYISNKYPVNKATFAKYTTKHIIHALESGHLVQTKGSGASGSIELSYRYKKPAFEKNTLKKKEKKAVKPKTPAAKKLGKPKTSAVVSKKVSPKKLGKSTGRTSKISPETPAKRAGRPAETPTKTPGTSKKVESKTQKTPSSKSNDTRRGRPARTPAK